MLNPHDSHDTTPYKVYSWLITRPFVLSFLLMVLTWAFTHITITLIKAILTTDTAYFSMWSVLGIQYVITPPQNKIAEFVTGFLFVFAVWGLWAIALKIARNKHTQAK